MQTKINAHGLTPVEMYHNVKFELSDVSGDEIAEDNLFDSEKQL